MIRLLFRRLVAVIPTLFVVTLVTFALVQLEPGSPAAVMLGPDATNAQIAQLNHKLGLDRPLLAQYFHWVAGVVHLNLGTSLFSGQSVLSAVASKLPITLSLTFVSTALAVVVGIAIGVYAGLRPRTRGDDVALVATSVGLAVPAFWLALLLVVPFALWIHLFPATGYVSPLHSPAGWLRSVALGSVALSVASGAAIARQTRASLAHVMTLDFIRAARARGLSRNRTVVKHGLKNASIPVVTILGFHVNALLGGALIVEGIFGLNGIGSLAIASVQSHDIPVVQGMVLMTALVVIVVNLLVDLAYGWLNPKVRVA